MKSAKKVLYESEEKKYNEDNIERGNNEDFSTNNKK